MQVCVLTNTAALGCALGEGLERYKGVLTNRVASKCASREGWDATQSSSVRVSPCEASMLAQPSPISCELGGSPDVPNETMPPLVRPWNTN